MQAWGAVGADKLICAKQKKQQAIALAPADPPPERGGTPASGGRGASTTPSGGRQTRSCTPSGEGTRSARPSTVPLRDKRPPLERLLDRRLQSVSTFVSSEQSRELHGKSGEMASQWSEEMPNVIMFPTNRPCSLADAVVLNSWITTALTRYAEKMAPITEQEENLSQVVDELIPILSIGLHEVVRQVTQHCLERGVVLEKIWRTYVELFERALAETRSMLRFHKGRTMKVQNEQDRLHRELKSVKQRHPEQIDKLSKTLLNKFAQRQEELEGQLRDVRHENTVLKKHMHEHTSSVNAWFPRYSLYKSSGYKNTLQSTPPTLPSSTQPESRIAADFKRIITAMPEDGRRRVGFFVSSLLGLRGNDMLDSETVDSLTEQRDHNAWQIDRLQHRIKELRGPRTESLDE